MNQEQKIIRGKVGVEEQLRGVLDCSIDRDGDVDILRGKGLLG